MHNRILNPFLLFKAAPNDKFSIFMESSFITKSPQKPAIHRHRQTLDIESVVWPPVATTEKKIAKRRMVVATKYRPISEPSNSTSKQVIVQEPKDTSCHNETPATDDFVVVNNWDSYHKLNAGCFIDTGSGTESDNEIDKETDFVFVD